MKTMRTAIVVVLAAVTMAPARAGENEAARKDMERLQGDWLMVSGSADGQAMPEEMRKQMKRICKGDEATTTMAGQVFLKAKITIDPAKKPKAIDYQMTEGFTKGQKQLGIYELEGDTFKSCFAKPGAERPADFTTKSGDGRTLSFWKRQESSPPRPPQAPAQEVAELRGPLVLASGRSEDIPKVIRDEFLVLAGGRKAKIVVIPTAIATADQPATVDEVRKLWQDLEPLSVTVLHTRDRKIADDPAFVKPLTEATAVWFTHGHRDRILKAYRGTLVERELKKLQARGGVIGGSGAGAAVMGDTVIDRANENQLTELGLGLLPGFLIEDGGAEEQFPRAVAAHPSLAGLMIDENTAVVIHGKTMRVMGEATVTVALAKSADKEAKSDSLKSGGQLDVIELRRAAASRARKD